MKMYQENFNLFIATRGSTHNHQQWPGGYHDHIQDAMNVAYALYPVLNARRPLPFSLSDALICVFLHDLEKPWRFKQLPDGSFDNKAEFTTKAERHDFRIAKLNEYKIQLTADHENGIRYAEGELADYSSTERKMGPLAAFVHACDNWSARGWFDYPKASNDPWAGEQGRPRSLPQ
jgi:hypothetical protein